MAVRGFYPLFDLYGNNIFENNDKIILQNKKQRAGDGRI